MVGEKRPLEADGAQEQEAAEKRPRTEPDPLKPSKPPKPGISMEALAKAKKVLELQAKLKEKIKNVLPQVGSFDMRDRNAHADQISPFPPHSKHLHPPQLL